MNCISRLAYRSDNGLVYLSVLIKNNHPLLCIGLLKTISTPKVYRKTTGGATVLCIPQLLPPIRRATLFLISTCTALQGLFCHLVPARILSVRIPGTFFAMYKNHLLKGALLLTAAGVFSRIIGFFYRIFLSRTFGAEQMGIYELISPVLALSFALCTSAIQSSISKFTAAEPEAAIYAKRRILLTGLSVSFVLSCLCTLFVWREADFISDFLLKETRCAPLLKIAALSFPAACIHSCINGYYYGIRKSFLPAFCQVFEQCFRVGSVMVFWQYATARGLSSLPQSDLSSGNALPWRFPFLPQESIFPKNSPKAFR